MADAINRTTGQHVASVDRAYYPDADWIIFDRTNIDQIPAILAIPQHYRKITGDVVTEMSQAEKDVVDAAAVTAAAAAAAVVEHADNTAAVAAGLAVGTQYRTGDLLKVVH